jgi:hypothetical protein
VRCEFLDPMLTGSFGQCQMSSPSANLSFLSARVTILLVSLM